MKITLFAKTAHSKDGKSFIRYIGKLKNKAGTDVTMTVKTSGDVQPFSESKCPYTVEFNKNDANLQTHKYKDKDGNDRVSYILWIKAYEESSEKYVDHSLDDFD